MPNRWPVTLAQTGFSIKPQQAAIDTRQENNSMEATKKCF